MSVKKRIKPGRIEARADGEAIVVNFTHEITHLDEDGVAGHVEKSPDKRELPVGKLLRGLPVENIPALAQEIVENCKYIPATKTKHVEQVLTKMHAGVHPAGSKHKDEREPSTSSSPHRASRGLSRARDGRHSSESSLASADALPTRVADVLPSATVDQVDEYADELYEERMELKARGAQCLLRVCTEVRHLPSIVEHSTLIGVLSRELRENAKRSCELAVAITGIFLCLARFSHFHGCLVQHQVDEVGMRVLEYESRRRTVLQKELKQHQTQLVSKSAHLNKEEKEKLRAEERRYWCILHRQDRLLQIILLALRNLAEDTKVEYKLVTQRLCHFLVPLLSRESQDLLITTLAFLHKLSVFVQNKDALVQTSEAMARLAELVGHPNIDVAMFSLRLCYNLTFDAKGRAALAHQSGFIDRLLTAMQHAQMQKVAMKVLYHLSIDTALRTSIAAKHERCIAVSLQLVAQAKRHHVDVDAAALCVNLAANQACASVMLQSEGFPQLVQRALHRGDPLLLKVLRHVASHRALRPKLLAAMQAGSGQSASWLRELLRLATTSMIDRPDALVEVLGTFAGLDCASPEVPWPELLDDGLLDLLHRLLVYGFADDDVLMECVILSGILALDPGCTQLLAVSKIPTLLVALLSSKQEDGEVMVQVIFALRCFLLQSETCQVIVQDTEAPKLVMDLLQENSHVMEARQQAVQAAGEDMLDLVIAVESQEGAEKRWTEQVKAFRFELHNHEWCQRLRKAPHEKGHKDHTLSPKVPALDKRDQSHMSDQNLEMAAVWAKWDGEHAPLPRLGQR